MDEKKLSQLPNKPHLTQCQQVARLPSLDPQLVETVSERCGNEEIQKVDVRNKLPYEEIEAELIEQEPIQEDKSAFRKFFSLYLGRLFQETEEG